MSREVDSGALEGLKRSFGIAGPGAGQTQLEDGELIQTVDTARFARRGSKVLLDGLFWGVMTITHALEVGVELRIDPYRPIVGAGLDANRPGYPNELPPGWDIYVLGVSLTVFGSVFQDVAFGLFVPDNNMAFNVLSTDDVVTAGTSGPVDVPLVIWDAVATAIDGNVFGTTGDGSIWVPLNQRVRRGTLFQMWSEITGAAAHSNVALILMGAFPAQLGQDVGV